jgi:hypothetical protein
MYVQVGVEWVQEARRPVLIDQHVEKVRGAAEVALAEPPHRAGESDFEQYSFAPGTMNMVTT